MAVERKRVYSGVDPLDKLLGGLFIGDNVIWHDDAGSLAAIFCRNFIRASLAEKKYLIYVTFDRSPKNLTETLGSLIEDPRFILVDCFTYGKGAGSDIFLKFYDDRKQAHPFRTVPVESPGDVDAFSDVFYALHQSLSEDVRYIFESLTGMQDLWGGEENLVDFYAHSCPRLYELNTVAYWIVEKGAHSQRFKSRINQIAQVVVDLSIRRGKTRLSILKAENRESQARNKPFDYWSKTLPDHSYQVVFDSERNTSSKIELGTRLKELRTRRGISQTELAKLVGVTPSNISQVENNLIYPSLPALIRIAEILSVNVSAFFQNVSDDQHPVVFPESDGTPVHYPDLTRSGMSARRLTPLHLDLEAEPFLIEIPGGTRLNAHFFIFKGEEMGYLLSGQLQIKMDRAFHTANPGDVIYLTEDLPSQWQNTGDDPARLLWIKLR
jgi:transcriptional regulator with XRE-family HTH domain/KaiC/GvpD/RAD55 family RecA-like ATPase